MPSMAVSQSRASRAGIPARNVRQSHGSIRASATMPPTPGMRFAPARTTSIVSFTDPTGWNRCQFSTTSDGSDQMNRGSLAIACPASSAALAPSLFAAYQ